MDEYLPQLKEAGLVLSYDYSNDHLKPGIMEKVAPYVDISLFSASKMTGTEMMEALSRLIRWGLGLPLLPTATRVQRFMTADRFYIAEAGFVRRSGHHGAGDAFISAFLVDFVGSKGLAGPAPNSRGGKNPPWAGFMRLPGRRKPA